MSSNKKGFDPLASLFDLPDSPPASAPSAPAAPPARGDALPDPPHVKPAPPVVPPVPEVAEAIEAPAPAPAKLAGPDPAELAKILARAAAAKAGAPKPAAGAPPAKAAPAAPAPKPAAKPVAPPAPAASPASRLMGAPPPKKSVSLEDALRAATEDEDKRKLAASIAAKAVAAAAAAAKAAPPAAPAAAPAAAPVVEAAAPPRAIADSALGDVVSGVIQDALPEIGSVYVAKALVMDDRGVLTALWRAHRARFATSGDLAGAVAVSGVLRALARVQPGQLAVAHAVTDKSDWLVWVDLSTSTLVAAFKDARAWFGGS